MDRPVLVVLIRRSSHEDEEQLRFTRSPVRVGRADHCELRIEHAFVSHQHGVLHFDASGVDFIDLGSTNGSYLEGTRVESQRFTSVHAGGELSIGIARLRVHLELPRTSSAPATHGIQEAPMLSPAASVELGAPATSLAAVIERFAESFLALTREQQAWRRRLGLAGAGRSGLHALDDAVALIGYLLTPGHEASRLDELDVACEELLCNERALVLALGSEPAQPLEAP